MLSNRYIYKINMIKKIKNSSFRKYFFFFSDFVSILHFMAGETYTPPTAQLQCNILCCKESIQYEVLPPIQHNNTIRAKYSVYLSRCLGPLVITMVSLYQHSNGIQTNYVWLTWHHLSIMNRLPQHKTGAKMSAIQ